MRIVRTLIAGLVLVLGATMAVAAPPSGTILVYTSQPSAQVAKVVEAAKAVCYR